MLVSILRVSVPQPSVTQGAVVGAGQGGGGLRSVSQSLGAAGRYGRMASVVDGLVAPTQPPAVSRLQQPPSGQEAVYFIVFCMYFINSAPRTVMQ